MDFGKRKPIEDGINMVPLINIVFLLLIFFMLTSTLVTPDRFDVDLPVSEQGRNAASQPITVLISPDGGYAINNESFDLGDLAPKLASLRALDPGAGVLVKADAHATTASVVNVLRRARAAGIERVALATQGGAP
jgi:biopolymer transport protein ExbD